MRRLNQWYKFSLRRAWCNEAAQGAAGAGSPAGAGAQGTHASAPTQQVVDLAALKALEAEKARVAQLEAQAAAAIRERDEARAVAAAKDTESKTLRASMALGEVARLAEAEGIHTPDLLQTPKAGFNPEAILGANGLPDPEKAKAYVADLKTKNANWFGGKQTQSTQTQQTEGQPLLRDWPGQIAPLSKQMPQTSRAQHGPTIAGGKVDGSLVVSSGDSSTFQYGVHAEAQRRMRRAGGNGQVK